MGSCVDISRMMLLASEHRPRIRAFDISQLPVVGCAPEWMSEKAVSIGNYVVATGIDTFLGVDPYAKGSAEVVRSADRRARRQGLGRAPTTPSKLDIEKLGDLMIERIEEKRAALGI